MTAKALSESAVRFQMKERVRQAFNALAGYKFWMFGYHAAAWVNLNRLLSEKQPNPFRRLVQFARLERERKEEESHVRA